MERTFKVQEEYYTLSLQSDQFQLVITVLTQDDNQNMLKLQTIVDISNQSSQLHHFQHASQIIQLMSQKQNYTVNLENRSIQLFWNISAHNYQKNKQIKINLDIANLSKMEILEQENNKLKKTLEKIRTNQQTFKQRLNYENTKKWKKAPIEIVIEDSSQENQRMMMVKQQINGIEQTIQPGRSKVIKKNTRRRRKPRSNQIKEDPKYHQNKLTEFIDYRRIKNPKVEESQGEEQFIEEIQDTKTMKLRKNSHSQQSLTQTNRNEPETKGNSFKNQKIQKSRIQIGELMRIDYRNGDYYYGEMKGDKYHGTGIYSSKQNGLYEGQWVRGFAEGHGVSVDMFGNKHTGNYKNSQKNGWGVDQYTNQQKYQGYFLNDQKNQFGTYTFSNGDVYQGEWKKDACHGRGKQIFKDSSFYQGIWENDEKNGEGIFCNRLGKKFKQIWKKGILLKQCSIQK